jgi:anti-sigma factor RsiW
MHISPGEIQAYHDRQLDDAALRRVEAHLVECPRCQSAAQAALAQSRQAGAHLTSLQPIDSKPMSTPVARLRLEMRLGQQKEPITMWSKLTSRISRPAWVGLALVVVLAISLAFPPVQAVANSFLKLFRVEQVRVLPVDTERLAGEMEQSTRLEGLFSESVKVEEGGEPQEVASAEEASARLGVPVRLPTALEGEPKIMLQPGGSVTFTVDLELMRAVLQDMGRSDIQLPDSLDGAVVKLEMPAGVAALYGDCELQERPVQDPDNSLPAEIPACTSFFQMPSPSVDAPPDLNVPQIGQIYLQLLGMTPDEAASFANNVDWTSTFVIPVPRYSSTNEEVQVDGVTGTLIKYYENSRQAYLLLWVKDGVVYALGGPGKGNEALQIAASLK